MKEQLTFYNKIWKKGRTENGLKVGITRHWSNPN